jgi:uncharacterized protein (UPF0335 family)
MAKVGHNSKVQAGPIAGERLKSFVERVEKLADERTAINGDIKDVLSEAKGVGYDVPAIRRLVTYRKMDAADRAEREALDAVYRHALGMAVDAVSNGDMSLREAAKAHGVSKSSIHRALSVPDVSREMVADDIGQWLPPHDPETGEVIDALAARIIHVQPPTSILPSRSSWTTITAVREAHHAAIEAARETKREARRREMEQLNKLAAITDDDMPPQPAFLRRGAA